MCGSAFQRRCRAVFLFTQFHSEHFVVYLQEDVAEYSADSVCDAAVLRELAEAALRVGFYEFPRRMAADTVYDDLRGVFSVEDSHCGGDCLGVAGKQHAD